MSSPWFEVESIDPETFVISEYKHWEQVHAYLLLGQEAALLIDTGLGISNIKEVVDNLCDLPLKVVTTHAHWDHIGGHQSFLNPYVHEDDLDWLRKGIPLPLEVIKAQVAEGIDLPQDFRLEDYRVFKSDSVRAIKDQEVFDLGRRRVRVIHTPGHSPGHICLYEEDRGYLFTGDLVYKGTLYCNYPSTDPQKFYESIKKISGLKTHKILPGHHNLCLEKNFVIQVLEGFEVLKKSHGLKQGSGVFDFGAYKIHL